MSQLNDLLSAIIKQAEEEAKVLKEECNKECSLLISETEKDLVSKNSIFITEEEEKIVKNFDTRVCLMELANRNKLSLHKQEKLEAIKDNLIELINGLTHKEKKTILEFLMKEINTEGTITVDADWKESFSELDTNKDIKIEYKKIGGGFIFISKDKKIKYSATTTDLVDSIWRELRLQASKILFE